MRSVFRSYNGFGMNCERTKCHNQTTTEGKDFHFYLFEKLTNAFVKGVQLLCECKGTINYQMKKSLFMGIFFIIYFAYTLWLQEEKSSERIREGMEKSTAKASF